MMKISGKKASKRRRNLVYGPLIFMATLVLAWWIVNIVALKYFAPDFQPTLMVADDELGWAIMPNVDADRSKWMHFDPKEMKYYHHGYRVNTNSMGFRGEGLSPEDAHNLRIVCIGDSSTFGLGEDEADIFPALLERELKAERPVRVYNLGVPGYSSLQGLLLWKRCADVFRPDFVVITFGANDCRGIEERPLWSLRPALPDKEVFGGEWEPGTWERAKYGALKRLMVLFRNSPVFFSLIEKKSVAKGAAPGATKPESPRRVDISDYRKNLLMLMGEAAQRKAPTALASICASAEYDAAAVEAARQYDAPIVIDKELYRASPDELRRNPRYSALLERMEKRFPPHVLKDTPVLLFTNDQCHPNPLGHKLLADALTAAIAKMQAESPIHRANEP